MVSLDAGRGEVAACDLASDQCITTGNGAQMATRRQLSLPVDPHVKQSGHDLQALKTCFRVAAGLVLLDLLLAHADALRKFRLRQSRSDTRSDQDAWEVEKA